MSTLRPKLWNQALDHYGFVTESDALRLGAAPGELARLARRGKLDRLAHGIYRFAEFPANPRDEYLLATYWPNRDNTALSHDTALEIYELCDINPDRIHLTVPAKIRINRKGGEKYVLHRESLSSDELTWWEGIRAVTEYTAIRQGIATGVPHHLLDTAIQNARSTGRITSHQENDLRTMLTSKLDD